MKLSKGYLKTLSVLAFGRAILIECEAEFKKAGELDNAKKSLEVANKIFDFMRQDRHKEYYRYLKKRTNKMSLVFIKILQDRSEKNPLFLELIATLILEKLKEVEKVDKDIVSLIESLNLHIITDKISISDRLYHRGVVNAIFEAGLN